MVKICPRPYVYRVATNREIGGNDVGDVLQFFKNETGKLYDVRDRDLDDTWFYSKDAAVNRGKTIMESEMLFWECESPDEPDSVANNQIYIHIGRFFMPKFIGIYGEQQCYKPADGKSEGVHPDGNRCLDFSNMLPTMKNNFKPKTIRPTKKGTIKSKPTSDAISNKEPQQNAN